MNEQRDQDFSEIQVELNREETVAVIHFAHHALVNPRFLQKARKDLELFIGQKKLKVLLIDLSEVDQAGSALFGLILHLAEEGRETGMEMRLCCLQPFVKRAFDLLNAGKYVQIFDDRRTALQVISNEKSRSWWKFW